MVREVEEERRVGVERERECERSGGVSMRTGRKRGARFERLEEIEGRREGGKEEGVEGLGGSENRRRERWKGGRSIRTMGK